MHEINSFGIECRAEMRLIIQIMEGVASGRSLVSSENSGKRIFFFAQGQIILRKSAA